MNSQHSQHSQHSNNLFEYLLDAEIYAWTTKKWASKKGLIETIGTIDDPIPIISGGENAYHIWNAKARVDGVELFMEIGKIYISFVSDPIAIHHYTHNHNLKMRFGIWIKIPDDKKKYIKNLEIRQQIMDKKQITKQKQVKKRKDHESSVPNQGHKKPRLDNHKISDELDDDSSDDSHNDHNDIHHIDKETYKGEIDLLTSRSLKELLDITEKDSYVQLGDLYFERVPAVF